jgi:putative transposase
VKARYSYRFYPTDQQKQRLAQLFGCVRVVWNDALALCKQSEKLPRNSELQKLVITQAKRTEEREWLSTVSSIPLQQSVADLGVAYSNFFNSLKGKQKGRKVGSPRFKKKQSRQTARLTRGGFSVKGGQVYLAKIGEVRPIWSRELPADPSSVTIIKDCADRYFLSFVVEIEPVSSPAPNLSVGIDLGIKTFAVLSNGEKVNGPNYSKLDRKLRRRQRRFAKQQKGSNRRKRTRRQLAKLHNKIADTRKDFLHKLSTRVVNENQGITLEDLNVSGMVKNRKLAGVISLQGWAEFRTLCQTKAERNDRQLVLVNRWEPTSQVCSSCGYKWGKLDLSVRSLVCLGCGTEHDRDKDVAININRVGIGHCHDLKRTGSDCKTTSEARCNEPSRIPTL